jgi:hypothetical protein
VSQCVCVVCVHIGVPPICVCCVCVHIGVPTYTHIGVPGHLSSTMAEGGTRGWYLEVSEQVVVKVSKN